MVKQHVVVVGGGFGGFKAIRALLRRGFKVTLVSENNFFYFTPMLIEVTTGTLRPDDICLKFTEYFKNRNFSFIKAQVDKIDFKDKKVIAGPSVITYDYVVIATGSRKRDLPVEGGNFTFALKRLDHAVVLKKALIKAITGPMKIIHFNVVGGGATGVELVFAVRQLAKQLGYSNKVKINILDSHDEILYGWRPRSVKYVHWLMKKKNIEFSPNSLVKKISRETIETDTKKYHSDFTVLTVGVMPNSSLVEAKYLDDKGYILADEMMRVKDAEDAFAIGDVANFGNLAVPKLAQTAWDQGVLVAKNIERLAKNKKLKSYTANLLGRVLTLGERRSVTEIKSLVFVGMIGNLGRALAYIYKMPGMKNKVQLTVSWITHSVFKINLHK